MKKILVITLAILLFPTIATAVTITIDSPIGIMKDSGSDIKNYNVELDENGRATIYFTQPDGYPVGENLETWGSIQVSSEEDKPVKVYLNKKVNLVRKNMPEKYDLSIFSEEKHCYKETIGTEEITISDTFFTNLDETTNRDFVYLPDFTNDYEITLDGKFHKGEQKLMYKYGPVVLKNGDTITVDEFEIYINGKKIERIPSKDLNYPIMKCFSFSRGTTILNFTEDLGNEITITVNSPEGYLLWRDNLRKELNNYEYLNDPHAKGKQFTSIELTQDSGSTSLNRGILAFSNEETKPININLNRRIGIDLKNLPKGYSAKIYSEEAVCDNKGKRLQETFYVPFDTVLDKSFYLPDFTNNFKLMIWTLDSKYMQKGYLYDLPELKHGYIMQVKEFNLLVNGKETEKEYFENKGKEFPPFNCYTFSEDWKKPIDNLTEEKTNIKFELQVKDFYTGQPINRAVVYLNDKIIGVTNSKGVIDDVISVNKEGKLKISATGYKTITQDITGKENVKLSLTLKPQYEPFEIPKGYENYVSTKKIYSWLKDQGKTEAYKGYVNIHPGETKLRTYSFPITSNEKKTVLKQVISRVRSKESPMITYDHSCVPEIQESCEAWHDSDYKILETKKGVCSDFATIAVSFANSYQIPTRRVSVAYDESSLIQKYIFRETNYGYHAFSEVYLSEEEGWKNFDITWKVLDNTCVYAKKGCLVYAKIIDENKETDLTEIYSCNKLCDKEKIEEAASNENAPAQTGTNKNTLLIDMSSDKAKVKYRTLLNKEDSAKILEIHKSKSFDENEAAKQISNEIKQGFGKEITAINPTFVVEEKEQIQAGVDFEFELPQDEVTYTLNTYQETYNVTLITPKNIKAVLPSFDSKETTNSIKYNFNFEEPGEYTIYAILNHKKSAVLSNDPLHKALADVLGNHISAESYTLEEQTPDVKRIYIIGDYGYVPSSAEDALREKNIEVIRFDYDDKYLSAQIAQAFWQTAEEVAITNMYDYASVKEARDYAIEKDIPLLFIGPDEFPDYVQNAIGFTGAAKTTIKDPKNKIKVSVDKKTQETSEKPKNTTLIISIIFITFLIITILLAYKFIKKPKKQARTKKKTR